MLGRAERQVIRFTEHLTGDGPNVYDHACRMGLEGIVSKRIDAPYRSGPSRAWLKSKNSASEAVRRDRRNTGGKNYPVIRRKPNRAGTWPLNRVDRDCG